MGGLGAGSARGDRSLAEPRKNQETKKSSTQQTSRSEVSRFEATAELSSMTGEQIADIQSSFFKGVSSSLASAELGEQQQPAKAKKPKKER